MSYYNNLDDKQFCLPCLVQEKILPLIENEYHEKMPILKLLDTIIIRNDKDISAYKDHYHANTSIEDITKCNKTLRHIEEMIFNNQNQVDVLAEIEIVSLTLGLVRKWEFKALQDIRREER